MAFSHAAGESRSANGTTESRALPSESLAKAPEKPSHPNRVSRTIAKSRSFPGRKILGLLPLLLASLSPATCLPFDQAKKHIGETQCVTGKVVRVETGSRGVHYLDFCEDYRLCPFSVVVFSYDLKNVGDVRQLAGKVIEIRGELKDYDGRAEIILENGKQLGGEAVGLPPMPKNFDVEQKGHFSAGQFRARHSRSTRKKKGHPTLPAEIPEDVESD